MNKHVVIRCSSPSLSKNSLQLSQKEASFWISAQVTKISEDFKITFYLQTSHCLSFKLFTLQALHYMLFIPQGVSNQHWIFNLKPKIDRFLLFEDENQKLRDFFYNYSCCLWGNFMLWSLRHFWRSCYNITPHVSVLRNVSKSLIDYIESFKDALKR